MVTENWQEWWEWPLELSTHLMRRMEDRSFSETDLRDMLEAATGFSNDVCLGRFLVHGRLNNERWDVVVEPDPPVRRLVVITAYRVE